MEDKLDKNDDDFESKILFKNILILKREI